MSSSSVNNPAPSVPTTMQAWTFNHRGSPASVLRLSTIPTPQPQDLGRHEVLIKVSHVGLNYGGILLFHIAPHWSAQGLSPENEFCGRVVALGSGLPKPKGDGAVEREGEAPPIGIGDEVIGFVHPLTMLRHSGALAAYIIIHRDSITRKPSTLSAAEAAGLIGCGWTAICAMDAAGVKRGDKVLVNGASGGLGSMLVQVAKEKVGESGVVVGVCSGRNEGLVRGLGVDEVVDYTIHSPLHEYLQQHHSNPPFNAIFDVIGNKALHNHCPSYLTQDGLYDLLGGMAVVVKPSWWALLSWMFAAKLEAYRPVMLGGVPRRHRMHNAMVGKEQLRRVVGVAEEGKLKVLVDSVWKMEDAVKAYERAMTQRAKGKIIIAVEE